MPQLSASIKSKLPKVGTTIFSKMSALAAQENAINLSQGFPDFDCSPKLVELVSKAMKSGANQYAPMSGLIGLREQISEKTEKLYTGKYKPDTEVTITAGATQAIFTAIAASIEEGDEVIIFTPAYDCYEPAIDLAGGICIFVELKSPEYRINWDEVKKLINQRTKMVIINTPHNPTGTIMTGQDMLQLEKILDKSDILVLSDEVYEHILFDGYEHQSVARFPKLAERSFIISSFGKTYHTTGWKIGYCLAPEKLMTEFRKAHQYNVFSVHTPSQQAYAEFLEYEDEYLNLKHFYQKKHDLFKDAIKESRFNPYQTAGSYFQLLDYSNISDENDIEFAERLTKEFKIASIPTSVFYNRKVDQKVLRFCFAKQDETLLRAAEILNKI
ncbi:MAG: methionine aminotransferase [Flavobacteriales bacterium]|nr:methionine aminotransferase [Flavobacteriales bacterium]